MNESHDARNNTIHLESPGCDMRTVCCRLFYAAGVCCVCVYIFRYISFRLDGITHYNDRREFDVLFELVYRYGNAAVYCNVWHNRMDEVLRQNAMHGSNLIELRWTLSLGFFFWWHKMHHDNGEGERVLFPFCAACVVFVDAFDANDRIYAKIYTNQHKFHLLSWNGWLISPSRQTLHSFQWLGD